MRPGRETVLSALTALLAKKAHPKWTSRFDAEDASMDAVLRVLQWDADTPDTLPVEEAAARRYAARAVQNILIDQFRQRHKHPADPNAFRRLASADESE